MSETLYGLRLFAYEVYNTTMNALIEEKIKMLPDAPGVYKMLDRSGNVIYVGKAKSLKNRVRQYFRSQNNMERKVVAMVSHIADFEYVLTGSETEAFALESNLIKAYKPQYNILLKDDKHFPYIRVDLNQDYPRFDVVRRVGNGSARYFGPYINSNAMNSALSVIRDYYPVRLCKKDIAKAMARHERPCLMYHIGKCSAPCAGAVTKEEYRAHVMRAVEFLKGDSNDVAPQLEKAMNAAAQRMEFELAAALRDRLQSVNALLAAQKAIVTPDRAMDVLALCKLDETIIVFSLFVRGGKVVGTQHADMKVQQDSADDEIMGSYIKQTYSDVSEFPNELIVNVLPDEVEELNDQLEFLCRPYGIMRRRVRLEKDWYKDAAGALLGTKKDGATVALIPGKLGGYSFYEDSTGKRVRLNRKTAALLEEEVPHMCQYFTVDDLNFLKRSGRVSGATAMIGTVLNIKPILYGTADGHIVSCGKVRGRKKAIEALAQVYAEKQVDAGNRIVAISHGDCPEDARVLAERVKAIAAPGELILVPHEPFSGAHVGPGMLALFFYGKER